MNAVEIDKLFPLIINDNFQELYLLVQNIRKISQDDPSIYKTIANHFIKNNQIDALFHKFTNLQEYYYEKKPQDDLQEYYYYEISKFYLNIICHYKNISKALRLLHLLNSYKKDIKIIHGNY